LQEDTEGRVGFLCSYVLIREFSARKLTRLMEGETAGKDAEVEKERIGKACEIVVMQRNEIPCENRFCWT